VTSPWLIRIPEVFAPLAATLLTGLEARPRKLLGADYHLVDLADPGILRESDHAVFAAWRLPLDHAWPCCPQKMDGFVEKAAQALAGKFAPRAPQALFTGPLLPGAPHPYYKHLATNLRGRALQLFPALPVAEVEAQDPDAETLFCLVGKEGLYAGMSTPRDANGFYPGGTKFIRQRDAISRAGAKIAEALHFLKLHRPDLPAGSHWLELGASPGGMTAELLDRAYRVTAVDRAPLDPRLDRAPGLTFVRGDVDPFQPTATYDALLCDMNGDPRASLRQVVRLAGSLRPGARIVFTLKAAGADTAEEMLELLRAAEAFARASGLRFIARTHLSYNRQEFTLFFELP
jgi:hypothetical protein